MTKPVIPTVALNERWGPLRGFTDAARADETHGIVRGSVARVDLVDRAAAVVDETPRDAEVRVLA